MSHANAVRRCGDRPGPAPEESVLTAPRSTGADLDPPAFAFGQKLTVTPRGLVGP